jgi:seryl-tRNA synthetase
MEGPCRRVPSAEPTRKLSHFVALDEKSREARSQATTLQNEYQIVINNLKEALRKAHNNSKAVRKETEGTSDLRAELSTAKIENEALQSVKQNSMDRSEEMLRPRGQKELAFTTLSRT